MVNKHPLLERILGPGFRITNPFKPEAVAAVEKPYQGMRFPTKFHFKGRNPDEALERGANLNSQIRISFVTDAENDYFRRDEQAGELTLFEVVDGELRPAKNWGTPRIFEGDVLLPMSLPLDAVVGEVMTFEAQITDPSRIEPFRNRFSLTVKPEREDHPRPPKPPVPKPDKPGSEAGKEAQNDTKLDVPNPAEIRQADWDKQDPPFDKFTAMRVRRPPGADPNSAVFDYFINMSNVFIDQAVKQKPKKAQEILNKYKFGMTFITLALIRQDLEMAKRAKASEEDDDDALRQDLRDRIDEVTTAIAPFLLPLVESLARITVEAEPLSEIAGEVA